VERVLLEGMTSRLLVCAALVLALAGAMPGVARADWDDRPEPSEYEESLNPYGYWVDAPGYGRVWRPNEDSSWRPYVDGQWIWTSYGWTWSSPEPWGWTFHYGRWGFANSYGWVWTPGYTWGPAWVDWYWGDGYVGWVPLAPAGFAISPGYWNYVNDYSFCSPRVNTVVVLHDRLPHYIVHHQDQGWGRRREPDFRDIEQVSRHRIVRENDRPSDSVAPWVRHRLERGEPVRERIDDRGRERVIEHAGRQTNLQGPTARDRDRPAVSNDDWRHRGDDDRGHVANRGPGADDDGGATNRAFEHRNRNDDRDERPEIVDVPRRPGHEGGDDRRMGPRVDDDRELTRPPSVDVDRNAGRPRVADDGAWSRPQPQPDVRVPRVDRSPSPGVMYRGGGGGAPAGGSPGGPMIIERSPGGGMGGGRAAGPTMQHGGGGGAPGPSPAPSAGSGGSMSHGGGGDHGGGGGGGHGHASGGAGSQGGGSLGGGSQGGGTMSR